MFKKILIANRGEIACRIHRTAHRMGIKTVAVYSEADRHALHSRTLDEALWIGPSAARQSYLVGQKIIDAAKEAGAQAIHPGYGFLSENADFAQAVNDAGLVFIGPDPASIRAMGSKSAAKELMLQAKVPVVPGYHGSDQEDRFFQKAAAEIGYPILIKAALGGGGKGMRRVDAAKDLPEALASARREAQAAFGDQTLLLEKYLQRPRHIEMQIFGDRQGNIVHLFERDCSLQRRHQKVIEEAPAPGFSDTARARLAQSALEAARAVKYVGAGTVEFIAEADALDRCYFMEMNTRLQVEHPVTEKITGIDLVEWQLRIAAGERLPLEQKDIKANGHALEMRICAEDPARDFLPSSGKILYMSIPRDEIRWDSGVEEGSEVSPYYDSMLAKMIVHASDRERAIEAASEALAATTILGVQTNMNLLSQLLEEPDFVAGKVETGFLAAHAVEKEDVPPCVLAAAVIMEHHLMEEEAMRTDLRSSDLFSPWNIRDCWRVTGKEKRQWYFQEGAQTFILEYQPSDHGMDLWIGGEKYKIEAIDPYPGEWDMVLDGERILFDYAAEGKWRWLNVHGYHYRLSSLGAFAPLERKSGNGNEAAGDVKAPMPGKISQILVESEARVESGQPVVILEAMKMEHRLLAPRSGKIGKILGKQGDQVAEGAVLLHIDLV